MRERGVCVTRWCLCIVLAIFAAAGSPARAHHQTRLEGVPVGVVIPAIAHGEMLVLAKYRAQILEVAARQTPTDPTLRRLSGFVNLQYFACLWGLVPGGLSDETSPFNECSHAYLAGARALLVHLTTMPGDQSSAKGLEARIARELASDPTYGVLCANSKEVFYSGVIIGPDWQLALTHLPTALTFSLVAIALVAIALAAGLCFTSGPSLKILAAWPRPGVDFFQPAKISPDGTLAPPTETVTSAKSNIRLSS